MPLFDDLSKPSDFTFALDILERFGSFNVQQLEAMSDTQVMQEANRIADRVDPRQIAHFNAVQQRSTAGFGDFESKAISVGMSRDELRNFFLEQGVTDVRQAKEVFNTKFDVSRYQEYRDNWIKEMRRARPDSQPSPVSLSEWQRFPEHRKLRLINARNVQNLRREGMTDLEAGGFTRRRDESFAFPANVLTQGSHLGIQGQSVVSTFDQSKIGKRIQMLGAHEMVQLHGRGVGPSRPLPMRSGPMSDRPETAQTVRAALVVGGSPTAAGQGLVDLSASEVSRRRSLYVPGVQLNQLTGLPAVGEQLPRSEGGGFQLAEQLSPVFQGSKFRRQRFLGGRQVGEEEARSLGRKPGVEFAFEQFAETGPAQIFAKAFGTKAALTPFDLSGVTGQQGQALNLSVMAELKDVGGAAFSILQAQQPEKLAGILGMTPQQVQQTSYAELGSRPLAALQQAIADPKSNLLQTIRMPIPGTNEVREMQALVGNMAMQFGEDFPVRQPRIGPDDMRNLERVNPQLAGRLQADPRSRGISRSFRDIINSSLATTGQTGALPGTLSMNDPQVRRHLGRMMGRIEQRGREMLPDLAANEGIPDPIARRLFLEEFSKFRRPLDVGGTVLPRGHSLQRFSASGVMGGEEVSGLVGSAFGLVRAGLGNDPERLATAQQRFQTHQATIASGKNAIRFSQSVFPGPGTMVGRRGRGDPRLAPHEAFVAGMGGQAVNLMGFPSIGGGEFEMTTRSLTQREMLQRGFTQSELGNATIAGQDIAQALQRDYDGDIFYALRVGRITEGPDGVMRTVDGRPLSTPAQIKEYALQAKRQGAANLEGEVVGQMTRGEAQSKLEADLKRAQDPFYHISNHRFRSQLTQGRELQDKIGPFFNTFRRGLTGLSGNEPARAAMQQLFNVSHGISQRPQQLPPELHQLQNMMRVNIGTGGFRDVSTGKPGRVAGPGFDALREAATRAVITAAPEGGDPFFSSETVAGLIGTSGNRQTVTDLVNQFRGGGSAARESAMHQLSGSMATEEFMTETGLGRLVGGQAVRRAMVGGTNRPAMSTEQIAQMTGFDTGTIGQLADIGNLQQQSVTAAQKIGSQARAAGEQGRPPTIAEMQADLIERTQAANAVNNAGFLQTTGSRQQTPTAAARRGRSGVLSGGILVGGPPAAGGGAGGQPPGPPPIAPPPAAAPPPPGGGGGGGRLSQFDFERQRPSVINASLAADVGLLALRSSELGEDFGMMAAGDLTLSRRQDPGMHAFMRAAENVLPNLSLIRTRARAISRGSGSSPEQRELAEEMLNNLDVIMAGKGENLQTVGNAFNVGRQTRMFPGQFETQVTQQQRAARFQSQDERFAAITQRQGMGVIGRGQGRRAISQLANQPGSAFESVGIRQGLMAEAGPIAERLNQLRGRFGELEGEALRGGFLTRQRVAGQQQIIAPEINQLSEQFKALTAEMSPFTAQIKEERAERKELVTTLKESRTEAKERLTQSRTALDTARRELAGARPGEEAEAIRARAEMLRERVGRQGRDVLGLTRQISREEELTDFLATPGAPAARTGRVTPRENIFQRGIGAVSQAFDPQRLFYRSQALAQGYYMLGAPLMQAREQFLSEQANVGRMQFALGGGGVGPEVQLARQQQATLANFVSGLGEGANQAVSPAIDFIKEQAENNEDFAPSVGKNLTRALGVGGAGFLLGGVGVPVRSILGGGLKAAAGLANPVTLGLGAGALGYEAINRQTEGQAFQLSDILGGGDTTNLIAENLVSGIPVLGQARRDAGLAPGTLQAPSGFMDTARMFGGLGIARAGQVAQFFGAEGLAQNLGERAQRFAAPGGGSGGTPTPSGPVPVSIENIHQDIARALGGEISDDAAAQLIEAFAGVTGVRAEDIFPGGAARQQLLQVGQLGLQAGVDPEQIVNFLGQVPGAAGIGFGSQMTMPILQQVAGAGNLAQMQSRLGAIQAVSPGLQQAGLFDQLGPASQQYEQILRTQGQFSAQRFLQQSTAGTAFDFTQTAIAAGAPELSLVDPDRPYQRPFQRAIQTIQARQQSQDVFRDLGRLDAGIIDDQGQVSLADFSGGRREMELDFMRDRMGLEQEFWDFRQDKRMQDFDFQVRQHDLTIRQMEFQLNRAEQYAQIQEQQARRNFELNLKLFDLQTQFQMEDFSRAELKLETRRGFQVQGFAMEREMFELQAGFQQEDLQRNLRFATGRQRLDVQRQLERSSIINNMRRTQQAQQETKAAVEFDFAREDIEIARGRFEQVRPLQRESMVQNFESQKQIMDLQKEDRAQQRAFMAEQIELQKDRFAAFEENFGRETELQNEQRAQEVEHQNQKIIWAQEDLELARERAIQAEWMRDRQLEVNEAYEIFNFKQQYGLELAGQYVDQLKTMQDILASGLSGGSNGEFLPPNTPLVLNPNDPGPMVLAEGGKSDPQNVTMQLAAVTEQSSMAFNAFHETIKAQHEATMVAVAEQSTKTSDALTAIADTLGAIAEGEEKEITIELDGSKVGSIVLRSIMGKLYTY